MLKKHLFLFVIAAMVATVAGCGDDDGTPTGGGGGTTDTTPPKILSVTAIDMFHVDVTFDEAVKKESVERPDNYTIVETAIPSPAAEAFGSESLAPGDTIWLLAAVAKDDSKVGLTTVNPMNNAPYNLSVTGAEDLAGNKTSGAISKSFTGSNATDTTPPEIVSRTPAPNATNVGVLQPVTIEFSEVVDPPSVWSAFSWTHAGGTVLFDLETMDGIRYVFTPLQKLLINTIYTIEVTTDVQDLSNNHMAATATWTFRTIPVADTTPPWVESTVPIDGATNVSVNTNLVLNFSEPIDTASFGDEVFITPDLGSGVATWSHGNATVTFDPDSPLMDNTQYTMVILPGGYRDLSGNKNIQALSVVWSTGSTLEGGSIAGTVSGDPGTGASNPAGGVVLAALVNPFSYMGQGLPSAGVSPIASGGGYLVENLADDVYYLVGAMDSNGDGQIDTDLGDAIGAYGIEYGVDMEIDSVTITGGIPATGIDFQLWDPVAVAGKASYQGAYASGDYRIYFGLFDTTGFDVNNLPEPIAGRDEWWPYEDEYAFSESEDSLLVDGGTYYVGAFLDVNYSDSLETDVDPAAFFGTGGVPTPITLVNGSDKLDADIVLQDPPSPIAAGRPVSWRVRGRQPADAAVGFRRAARAVREALERYR